MLKSILQNIMFVYTIPVTIVPLNGTANPQINFNNDSDFLLTEIRATTNAVGAVLMQLSTASGELLSNALIDTALFSGANYPVRLATPMRIPANTQLNVFLQNTTGGNLTTQVQLWGYKVDRANVN